LEHEETAVAARRAVTLIELLVVVSIIGVLATLLLPAIQASRESARAARCKNNLKQIGVALLNFESVRGSFPEGAEGRYERKLAPAAMFGLSWWAEVLPFLEESEVADRLDRRGAHTGWVQLNEHNGQLVDRFAPSFWLCPSSSIEPLVTAGNYQLAAPSYVGVSGASSHDGFPESRVSPCCRSDGEISAGGVLVPNRVIRLQEISDGLTNTLLAGEQSDFAYTDEGLPMRIDGGFPNGWVTGTKALGVPPEYGSPLLPTYNLVTVRYPLNEHRYNLPGVYTDRGANNPLLSPHGGVVHLLSCDGSVHATADSMDVVVLKSLASRDDGSVSGKADRLRL
jgi:prepilin-type N-terminal cleavage/methylation domain-containing protein